MKWKGKEDFEKIINDLNNKILDKNLSKIADPAIDTVVIFFPYNQAHLFEPDSKDWEKVLKDTKDNIIVIAFPNGLKKSKPDISDSRLIITINEMVLRYWEEIRDYIISNRNIEYIKIISSDIDIERVKRDFNIIFSNFFRKFEVSYSIVTVRSSFWKKVYQLRETLVLALPIWFYKQLGKSR